MMLIKRTSLVLLTAALMISGCKKKEVPVGVPTLSTTAVTNILASAATSGGTISGDGGASITSSGICWSKTNQTPTTSDEKVEGTVTSGVFTAELTNLSSSSTYYVRAYAINSAGIGYGNVVTFATGNAAPVATNIAVAGEAKVNATLTATYTYTDLESDSEGGSIYKWYVANDATGTGETAISGANAKTYVVQEAEQGKFIRFGVTPKSNTGTLEGTEVKSSFLGAIGDATTVTFMYNGASVTYGIINSPTTGRKWLDRNLGAPSAANSFDNYQNYGDLFQWGRLSDGHQLMTRNGLTDADMVAVKGSTDPGNEELSATDVPNTGLFIVSSTPPADWRLPQNDALWQGVNGINNPCPSGWRLPTKDEWAAENIPNIIDGFNKLRLVYTSQRSGSTGSISQSQTSGNYWSSTIGTTNLGWAVRIRFFAATFSVLETSRAQGNACRCIKN